MDTMEMIARFAHRNEWKSFFVNDISGMVRMNQYMARWLVVLDALRKLWEMGKVSELKSPFYEPVEKPAKN